VMSLMIVAPAFGGADTLAGQLEPPGVGDELAECFGWHRAADCGA
jgi:hypothetical protein